MKNKTKVNTRSKEVVGSNRSSLGLCSLSKITFDIIYVESVAARSKIYMKKEHKTC